MDCNGEKILVSSTNGEKTKRLVASKHPQLLSFIFNIFGFYLYACALTTIKVLCTHIVECDLNPDVD